MSPWTYSVFPQKEFKTKQMRFRNLVHNDTTTMTTHRRPNPKTAAPGLRTAVSKRPLASLRLRYRSGRYLDGSMKAFGSCIKVLIVSNGKTRICRNKCKGTYHMFPMTSVPFGMKYPSYSSSSVDKWGIPRYLEHFSLVSCRQYSRVKADQIISTHPGG